MSPSNRSKSRKTEIPKSQKGMKLIDTEVNITKSPVIVSPPRTDNISKKVTKSHKCMLESFGIKPGQRKEYTNERNTKLKCCVIETPGQNNTIIFRFEPYDKKASCWCEKLLLDDVKIQKDWVVDLNFDDFCYTWYENSVPQQNNKGFPIRLFCINIDSDPPTLKTLLNIGKHICETINAKEGNKTKALVDEKDFIWIKKATWSEIIGHAMAQKRLQDTIGKFNENSYLQYCHTISAFFREDDIPDYLAKLIGAPKKEFMPDFNDTFTQDDDSDNESNEHISLNK